MQRSPSPDRIFLSPPHMSGREIQFVQDAFDSNYIAPLGPQVDAFEKEFSEYSGIRHCVALTSGTAAMHLALRFLGVGAGDEVFASTLTFIGSVSPVTFLGATPVFIDCDTKSWNMDPDLLEKELTRCADNGRLPKAVIPTDLYGQCCDLGRILEICNGYGVPVVCDSAEAMGAGYWEKAMGYGPEAMGYGQEAMGYGPGAMGQGPGAMGQGPGAMGYGQEAMGYGLWARGEGGALLWHAGRGARASVFSFNGNKIMTTSGGGMLASDDKELIEKARFWSQQARDPLPHYEHTEIGYNYRMSNIVAAIGRGQLRVLEERVKRKREIFEYYRNALEGVPGIEVMPEAAHGRCNRWLTVILITPAEFGADREAVRLALEAENIESRPVWKPMHLQPVFDPRIPGIGADFQKGKRVPCRVVGGAVSEDLFARGLCLPSGTAMTEADLDRVVRVVRGLLGHR